jgi:hypothetical protein
MQHCDFVLTPVVDPGHLKWSRPGAVANLNGEPSSLDKFRSGQLEAFEAAGWQEYLGRYSIYLLY